jgi:hypothetical protein
MRAAVINAAKSRFRRPLSAESAAASSAYRMASPAMRWYEHVRLSGLHRSASRASSAQASRWCLCGRATPTRRCGAAPFTAYLMRAFIAYAVVLSQCPRLLSCSHAPRCSAPSGESYPGASCVCSSGVRGCSMPPVCPGLWLPVCPYPAPPGFRRCSCGLTCVSCAQHLCHGRCAGRAGTGLPAVHA